MKQRRIKIFRRIGIGCASLLLCLAITTGNAQEAITASGEDATGSGGSVAYSVGQVVYNSNTGSNGSVHQGVQQPYEIFAVGIKEAVVNISLSVYPNPIDDILILQIDDFHNQKLTWQLFNLHGELLEIKQVNGRQTLINSGSLAPAPYILSITQENKIFQSFKIIKH